MDQSPDAPKLYQNENLESQKLIEEQKQMAYLEIQNVYNSPNDINLSI